MRKISKIPFKVLDAPELQDDFYLNLVDWSSQNVLSVGLGTCVYLWSACTSQVMFKTIVKVYSVNVLKFGTLFYFLFLIKLLVFRAGIHKMLVRISNREDPDQTASESSEAV